VAHVPDLSRLQAKVSQSISDLDIELERRKFTPHVTVARLHDTPIERLQSYLSGNSPFHGGTERTLTFTLFESVLTKDGSAYHKLMEYPLV
jgi:2'-5' RNA ligase